ncbi:MAG: amidohydrolase [Acidimicrobiia bacterium]|nr:amidohydrolase [Acidimicrobiia bacterium]
MPQTRSLESARRVFDDVVALRRKLHRHPEVGNHLPVSRKIILDALFGLEIEIVEHETTSGVVGILRGGQPGPTVVLRADFDALHLHEDTGLEFASEYEGQMHACGHDLHTAMLFGAARLLSEEASNLAGNVLFMFQPGEEGHHGARFMLDEGLLDTIEPRPTRAFAIHVSTLYRTGTVNIRSGPMMAAADKVVIVVKGRGGHASAPHNAADPVSVAAEIVMAVQMAMTRQGNVFDPAVVTFGMLQAGSAYNIIPETATLTGTTRTMSADRRKHVHEMIRQVANGVAAAHGVAAETEVILGYPVTINDREVTDATLQVAAELLGQDRVHELSAPSMGAEDWSYVLEEVPGVMAFLGACPDHLEPGNSPANHSNRVVFDEAALNDGVALHVAMVHRLLADAATD